MHIVIAGLVFSGACRARARWTMTWTGRGGWTGWQKGNIGSPLGRCVPVWAWISLPGKPPSAPRASPTSKLPVHNNPDLDPDLDLDRDLDRDRDRNPDLDLPLTLCPSICTRLMTMHRRAREGWWSRSGSGL